MIAMKTYLLIPLLIINTLVPSVKAEERIDMEGISIIGNKELPNVLYIVPWKTPELPDMTELPLSTLINNALVPIERQSVLREEQYYNALKEHELSKLKTNSSNPE